MSPHRIEAQQAREDIHSGNAVLVCAYEEPDKCERYRLVDALSLKEFHAHEEGLPKGRKVLFYCA